MKKTRFTLTLTMALSVVALFVVVSGAGAVNADTNPVSYRGQGLIADGFGGYDLGTEICGVENGAEVDGPYLLWVMTATGASNAEITFAAAAVDNNTSDPDYGSHAMTKYGNGTFKYVSSWHDPSDLPGNVNGTYDGKPKNVQLVISHGCRPFKQGAWCSPGFWRNAEDAAWALVGRSRSELFNTTVFDEWYGATFAENPTLNTVLTTDGGTYKGDPVPGASGYELNAFNATGAFLTNNIPGYEFDWDVMKAGGSDACPIDHHGNFKQ